MHNRCADNIPFNAYRGANALVNGKAFDALQIVAGVIWEVKTDNFESYPLELQDIVVRKQVRDFLNEREHADLSSGLACGASNTKGHWSMRIRDLKASSLSWNGVDMPATRENQIGMITYAPALAGDDGRTLAVVHGLERARPGLRIGMVISDEGQLLPLPDRDGFVARESSRGEMPLLRSTDDDFRVSVTGWGIPASLCPGGRAQFEFHVALPLSADGVAGAPALLEAVAEAGRAFWGHATPFNAGVDIARQTKNRPDDLEPPPRGLPVIKSPSAIRAPEIPHRLGWLNYWSAAAAHAIGFPDASRDAELLARARRTPSGGWVVQLTDAPLDLDHPDHLAALLRAYVRFPEIGGRSAP